MRWPLLYFYLNLKCKKFIRKGSVDILSEYELTLLICLQDFTRMLQLEEEHVLRMCSDIIALKPDLVFTEKGVSDLAQHYLLKAGITAIRRYAYLHLCTTLH